MAVLVECKVGNSADVLTRGPGEEVEVNSCRGMLAHPLSLRERAACWSTNDISKATSQRRVKGKASAEGRGVLAGAGTRRSRGSQLRVQTSV